jgi:hypothetical protein
LAIRPWHLRWGATKAEATRHLAGDDLIHDARSESTRALTIHAPVDRVWPWVAQMGQERGGLYSYEWLENLVGCDIHNAERVVPEWQQVRVGDTVRLASAERYPFLYLLVEQVEAPRVLVLRSPNVGGSEPAPATEYGYSWAFVLEPQDGQTCRLLVRSRYQGPPAIVCLMEAIQFVMERALLRGLKQRAERTEADMAFSWPVAAFLG